MINVDELTIGDLKRIWALQPVVSPAASSPHHMIGKYVICRCVNAGVHAGTLMSKDGTNVELTNSRRLWSWKANDGVALSGLSQFGLQSGKVDTLLPEISLTDVIEIIPCSEKAKETIHVAK